ncbi:2-keto-4-pentenoate hydratase/2-oxohepta-3-ene-1,7-dioic acid hydratase in catechol pathway [Phycicoccus badiiscoriae]|uniref:2-keto-4-pentenoate hydratase/2-oxohepta-3-ene-1,7-dioic acid hydratase in catechol pathway n=1 Tax=Pedococcus badiiscoriae TaxID=642776 RepID=A0A852WD49_9MICO|nr:2-keto-4-pentenoate hydratase/2-oxohepta-3-ene-1,7-dioic acid hydratase in catechol pathway [Pedococcus badiiscoriae]
MVAPDGSLLDLGGHTGEVDGAFLGRLASIDADCLAPFHGDATRFGAPFTRPGKVVGIGLNYRDHAAEARVPLPTEPVVFLKASTSVCGPTDDIQLLPQSVTTDYEVELGVILGAPLKDERDPGRALAAVAGYVLAHDVSDRALQLERGGTWTKGKSADTFCPVGPWLVTPDELGDPADVRLRLSVNDAPRQDGWTGDMLFSVPELLCYVSGLMTLEPGDLVITGTPAGVAMGQPEPKPYLRHGDLVCVDGGVLGRHRNRVVDAVRSATPAAAS